MSPCLRRLPAFLSSLLTALLGALIAAVPMAALAGVAPSLPTSMTAASPVAPGPREAANLTAELVAMNRWATPGSTAVVALRQQIAPGWHTYWRNPGDSGGPTSLNWTLPSGVTASDIIWPLPERQNLGPLLNYGYSGEVWLPVLIAIPAAAPPGRTLQIQARADLFVCSDELCIPVSLDLALDLPVAEGTAPEALPHGPRITRVLAGAPRPGPLEARLTRAGETLTLSVAGGPLAGAKAVWFYPFVQGALDHAASQPAVAGPQGLSLTLKPGRRFDPAVPLEGVLATDAGAWQIRAEPGPALAGSAGGPALRPQETATVPPASPGLILKATLFALLGGLILNLMPCVFPVLAMKAAALAGGAHAPAEARRDGLAYTLGVLVSFLALAGALLALRAGGEAIGWGFQLQVPAVTATLALVMLAVGLNLSGLYRSGSGLQALGGRVRGGGAFLTGVLAVIVAAPCTAPFMAFALGAALTLPAVAALAVFAALGIGFALPFLAVSLSPALLRRLPRPGPWMLNLQRLLALPMYATALWLAWVFSRQSALAGVGLLALAALALTVALVLWGRRQTLDPPGTDRSVPLAAPLVAALSALVLTGLAARIAPPQVEAAALDARAWSPAAVEAALAAGRPVLVNLTADWCVTCKFNEATALETAPVRAALDRTGAAYLVGDWTRRDAAIAAELERHSRSGVPLYLVHTPGRTEPELLPQLLTPAIVARALDRAAADASSAR
jgi:thiol:disulfide interchange protein DsbD